MPSTEEVTRAYRELLEESNDRAVAVVGATLLEGQLEEAIMRRLLPMSNNHRDALFRDDNAYTFAPKIDLGLSLGLYGEKTKTDLHRIKKIRNEFAHNIDRAFSHDKIIKACRELTDYVVPGPTLAEAILGLPPESAKYVEGREWRWRYLFAVAEIGAGLLKETLVRVEPPRPTVLKG